MKHFSIAAALIAASALSLAGLNPAAAQDEAPVLSAAQLRIADKLIDDGLKDDVGWEVLESLTTQIGPRLGGSPAEARAREWGVAQLKALGFKNVRIEPFEMAFWERVSESAEITFPFPQPLAMTALGNSSATPKEGVTGEVVRFRTLPELQAAPEDGLEGKIVFVDEPMARTQDGSGYGIAVRKRGLAAVEAGKRGAAGVLIRSAGTSVHRHAHTGGAGRAPVLTAAPIGALSNSDADQVARAIERAEGPVKIKMNIQMRTAETVMSGNVVGEIPGKTDELIVVGGHLDSWDQGTGALDDGAGIAITTAAAKLVGDLRGRPKRTIRVVMWGAEEVGLFGARAYAERHADQMHKHVVASESDFGAGLIYRFDTRFGETQLYKARPMANVLRRLAITPGNNEATGGPDVGPIRQAGVPVVSLRQDGTDYFDYHHTPDDVIANVDPQSVRQNIAAWAAFIYMASEMDGDFRDAPTESEE